MGWLIVLGVLILLAALPLGVHVRYDEGGTVVKVVAGFVRIALIPRKKKGKKPEKEEKNKKNAKSSAKEEEKLPKPPQPPKEEKPREEKKKGGSLADFLPLVKVGLDFLSSFRRKLRLNILEVKVILAGDDPCDLAANYGRAWAAVGNLMPQLERYFVIKKRDIEIECDFTAQETLVNARLELTITLGRMLSLAMVYGIRGLKEFINLKNKRKGGAVT